MGCYKLRYCEFYFSKNLNCNYISIKDQIFYKYPNKNIRLDVEEETTTCSNWADYNYKPFICLQWYENFIFVSFRTIATPLFYRNKTVFEMLMKDMAMKSFDLRLTLMTLVIVYAENVPIYGIKCPLRLMVTLIPDELNKRTNF